MGRALERNELVKALQSPTRLVTLRGPGGVGKSRLALVGATEWARETAASAWYCDLVGIGNHADFVAAVAAAVELPLVTAGASQGEATLGKALRARGRILLVLDHADRVSESVASASERWRREAPELVMLVTSRAPLRATGEVEVAIGPLTESDAVELMRSRALVAIDPHEDATLARIAAMVDRLPLAIELVARRTALVSPRRIELDLRGQAGAAPSERGLDAVALALDGSYESLAPAVRAAFEDLAVLPGVFTLETAGAVVAQGQGELSTVLQALLDHSLLFAVERGGERAFSMLTLIREYAQGRARASERMTPALHRLCSLYEHRVEDWARALDGPEAVRASAQVTAEREACFAAIAVATALHPSRRAWMATVVVSLLSNAGPFDALEAVLAAQDPDGLPPARLARFHLVRGTIRRRLGKRELAEVDFSAALRAANGDRAASVVGAHVEATLGVARRAAGRVDEARAHFARALELAEQAGDGWARGSILCDRAKLEDQTGAWGAAAETLREALACAREARNVVTEANVLVNLGDVLLRTGEVEESHARLDQALALAERTGNRRAGAVARTTRGQLYLCLGRLAAAEEELRAAWNGHLGLGETAYAQFTLAVLAECLAGQGRDPRSLLDPALAEARESGDSAAVGLLRMAEGVSALQGPTVADGELPLREAIDILGRGPEGLRARCLLAEILLRRGDVVAAEAVAAEALRTPGEPVPPMLRAHVLLVGALLRRARGESAEVDVAVRVAREGRAQVLLARLLAVQALEHAERNEPAAAERALSELTEVLASIEDLAARLECGSRREAVQAELAKRQVTAEPRAAPGPPATVPRWVRLAAIGLAAAGLVALYVDSRSVRSPPLEVRSAEYIPAAPDRASARLEYGFGARRALVIGVGDYPPESDLHDLDYALADAESMAEVLAARFGFTVTALFEQEATRAAIIGAVEGLSRELGKNDQFLLFFAGHGVTMGDQGYLVPYDGRGGAQGRLAYNVDMAWLREKVGDLLVAKHKLMILDACFGGSAMRGSAPERPRISDDYYRGMTLRPAFQLLTAGAADQEVLDGGADGHSVFTGALLEILRSEDRVSARDLSARAIPQVFQAAQAVGKRQDPTFVPIVPDGDFVFVPAGPDVTDK